MLVDLAEQDILILLRVAQFHELKKISNTLLNQVQADADVINMTQKIRDAMAITQEQIKEAIEDWEPSKINLGLQAILESLDNKAG